MLLLILILAIVIRIGFLAFLPNGISSVELDYIINAKSVWLSGMDIAHLWSPLGLKALDSREILAELPALLWSPFIGPFKFSLLMARLPNALLLSLATLVIYSIVKKLFKNQRVGILTALMFAINPWTWHFGRTAYEVSLSLVFFLLFWWSWLKFKGYKKVISFVFVFLSFFSYHGFKPVIPLLVLIVVGWDYLMQKKPKKLKPGLIILSLTAIMTGYFLLSFSSQSALKRKNEIVFLNFDKAAATVNLARQQMIPNMGAKVFNNKVVVIGQDLLTRYLKAFSISYWFINGDSTGVGGHTLWNHGYFYYLDIVVLLIGFVLMWKNKRKVWGLLTLLLLAAPIPSAISSASNSYVHRSAMMVPILIIFIGYGLSQSGRWKNILLIGYLISMINLSYIYIFRYPIFNAEGFFFSRRVLSEYVSRVRAETDKKIYVVSEESMANLEQYLFYSNQLNTNTSQELAQVFKDKIYQFDGIVFDGKCPPAEALTDGSIIIYDYVSICPEPELVKTEREIKIVDLKDSGYMFKVFKDPLCEGEELNPYSQVKSLEDFNLSKESNQGFCKNWLISN